MHICIDTHLQIASPTKVPLVLFPVFGHAMLSAGYVRPAGNEEYIYIYIQNYNNIHTFT